MDLSEGPNIQQKTWNWSVTVAGKFKGQNYYTLQKRDIQKIMPLDTDCLKTNPKNLQRNSVSYSEWLVATLS